MAATGQSRGTCAYCGYEMTRGGITRHLDSCPQRKKVIEEADRCAGKKETLYHLRIQDYAAKEFWLDLEMRGTASLDDLDRYLRDIWLECCGHLSQFSLGGWSGDELNMRRRADRVLTVGLELTHIYDFGTSSETLVRVVAQRTGGATTKHPIALKARNLPPEPVCMECDQPAAWLCMECVIEEDAPGWLCNRHVKRHPHEDYGDPVPLVNSPRLGMCGYDGPADPPY